MKINQNNAIFVMIDIQEKFIPVIPDIDLIVKNSTILNKSAEILDIPQIITEQYPKGLGKTISSIFISEKAKVVEKNGFSIFNDEIKSHIKSLNKQILVLYGIEAHICLTQTALDALKNSYNVYFVADAVSSRDSFSKEIAFRRLEQAGVKLVTTEMLLFEILESSKHPNFKEISNLVK
jgi:isochorismate hydrolase